MGEHLTNPRAIKVGGENCALLDFKTGRKLYIQKYEEIFFMFLDFTPLCFSLSPLVYWFIGVW